MTMLRLVQQGLRDIEETEHDRILLGFFSVVVLAVVLRTHCKTFGALTDVRLTNGMNLGSEK
jgi:hypothetical protein